MKRSKVSKEIEKEAHSIKKNEPFYFLLVREWLHRKVIPTPFSYQQISALNSYTFFPK
ncbi:hypothetical protein ACTQ5K_01125 [Niallia sp. Sow4_A1]|jgi:hypothetical protein|uniref:Uncharacterized protein n=1 Tax=Niallia hominis TaxID=3133173 RepID=A0ABV1EYG4_9BACI|nr:MULTISPECIES: hypothetical protein [Bacillaceae]